MATTNAIAATSTGILRLLEQAYDASRFGGRPAIFALYRTRDFHTPMTFGLSLFLWSVEPSGIASPTRARPHPLGIAAPPPLPVDLHYLMTAWADEPAEQQALLGWAMRALHGTPVLPATVLNVACPGTFDPGETVELSAEHLSRQDLAPLWALMAPDPQPSAAYVARAVELASGAGEAEPDS